MKPFHAILGLVVLATVPAGLAELPVKAVLTLNAAKRIAAAAEAEAARRHLTAVVVVCDDGGHLLVLHRTDRTQVASVEVGIGKARTAAIFRRPSKDFEDQVREGRIAALALPGATPLQGGIPIRYQGEVIGAIGVSGESPQEDEDVAKAGAAAADSAIAAESQMPAAPGVQSGKPGAIIDLATDSGVALVKGQWRYHDTKIVDTDFRAAGADGQPGTQQVKTYDYTPHAGAAGFDDSGWETIAPATLGQRRANGRLCFNWYRIGITIPDRIGDFDPAGMTVVFETSVDDYAEVWVDGELTRALGQMGGSVISGWNAGNRLVIGRNMKPGQKIRLAVFGINGPISNPPTNYIFMRYAKLLFYRTAPGPVAIPPSEVNVEVLRVDPAMDAIVPANAKIYKLAEGFQFTEGPVWVREGGYLNFSDPNANTIYKYKPAPNNGTGRLSIFRTPGGYSGADIAEYGQPGSNGLTLDPQGRLTINEHGNHRVTRLERDGSLSVLADKFEGKRLNSPNDLVYRSDGTLFFTDPPFGLPKFFDDPRRELLYSGVFAIHNGKLKLLSTDLKGPNGIAFSPDEKYLYVTNWDEKKKIVMRYEVQPDATLKNGQVFFDMTSAPGEDALDGVKVDEQGNLYVSGPGGLWIISAAGKHLGTIVAPKQPHNLAWGDEDGKTLYLCALSGLYRMRLNIAGIRP
jgi:gluconolactonase